MLNQVQARSNAREVGPSDRPHGAPHANSTPPMPTEGRQQTGRLQRTPKHPWLAASILGAQCDPPSWGRLGVQQKDAICAPSRSQARVAKTRVGGRAK